LASIEAGGVPSAEEQEHEEVRAGLAVGGVELGAEVPGFEVHGSHVM